MNALLRKKPVRHTPYAARLAKQVIGGSRRMDRSDRLEPERQISISVEGRFRYDPTRSPEDFRRFLWAALPLIRAEAKSNGLTDTQTQKLLVNAFDFVQECADPMWLRMKSHAEKQRQRRTEADAISVVNATRADPQLEALSPKPEFVWNRSIARAMKAAREFSKETHANY